MRGSVTLFVFFLFLFTGLPGTAALSGQPDALLDENFSVPAHQYGFIPARVANWPCAIDVSFHVLSGAPVRVELVSRHDLNAFIRGKAYDFLIQLSPRTASEFRQPVPERGEYDILLINDGSRDSSVQVNLAEQFAREPDVAQYLSPVRRKAVILISVAVFLVILGWSGLALLRAMRRARISVL